MTSKSIRVNSTEEGDEDCDVRMVSHTNQNKRKCLYLGGCGLVILALLATTIILTCLMLSNEKQNEDDDSNQFLSDKESAAKILDYLKRNSSDFDSFDEAFNVFDNDNDGYLNQTEFAEYFEIEIRHSATFPKIDVDNDSILSYPEVVTYVSQLSQIDFIFDTVFKQYVIPLMVNKYNYQYSNETVVVDTLFNEYASMIMYFDIYDLDSNGYIRYDEYSSIAIQNDFKFADINSDNKLSKDELFNLLYSDAMDNHHHSFSGALNEIFHNDANAVQLFGESLVDISITREQVMNINLNLCPLQSQSDNGDRRRLNEGSCNGCPITLPYNCREVCWCEGNIAPCCFELCDYFTICLPPGSCIPGR